MEDDEELLEDGGGAVPVEVEDGGITTDVPDPYAGAVAFAPLGYRG